MRVCIIGAGLTSLTLAKALVNQKIYVDVYTEKKIEILSKSRTLGISKSNIVFFNKNIVDLKRIIWKLKKIEIFSDNLKNEKILNFKNSDDQLFSVIKNFKLYNILENSLRKNKYFKKIIKKISFDITNKYDFIINTDNYNVITKKLFNKKIIKEYNSFAYTTIIKHKKILNDTAVQIFTKKGPLAFLPISKTETSIVYSINNLNNNNNENIKKLIKGYNFKYKIHSINKIEFFELKSLNLRSYYNDNVLAFGDLLHRIHPLAGQGFNMTIRDIKILSSILIEKKKLGLPLDKLVCSEFEKKSKSINFIFSNGVDLVNEFFNFERKTNNSFLSKSVQLIGKNPSINKMFTKIADKGILF